MRIDRMDHIVLTVADVYATVAFYEAVLGFQAEEFGDGRVALRFGGQKINLHPAGEEYEPKAGRPTPGSADLCFVADASLEEALEHVQGQDVPLVEGPVDRIGAQGPMRSFYIRDPDGNLIEIASYGSAERSG